MSRSRKLILAAVLLVTSVLASIYFYELEKERQREVSQAGTETIPPEAIVPDDVEAEKISAEIYVYRINADLPGAPKFSVSERELTADAEPLQKAREIVTAVLDELSGILPSSTRLLELYLLQDGTALVDLSGEVSRDLTGSVEVELGILQSLTRSLRKNVPEIRQVKFLVEGQESPTLAGHVSIQLPFR